jgi:hypothetical protein
MKNPILIGALVLGITTVAGGILYVTASSPSSVVENNTQVLFTSNNTNQPKNFVFTKDSSHVYVNGQIIEGLDSQTFEYIGEDTYAGGGAFSYYVKDANHVFIGGICGRDCLDTGEILPGADPKTFIILANFADFTFEKDSNHVYLGTRVLEGADVDTFNIKEASQALKDEDNIWWIVRDKNKIWWVTDEGGNDIPDDRWPKNL